MMDYRRHRFVYSFRAWVDDEGSNADRHHQHRFGCQLARPRRCSHLRLWDLNTNGMSHNIVRVLRRRRPFALGVYLGRTQRIRVQIGLPR